MELNEQVAKAMGVEPKKKYMGGNYYETPDEKGDTSNAMSSTAYTRPMPVRIEYQDEWPDFERDATLIPQMVEWLRKKCYRFNFPYTATYGFGGQADPLGLTGYVDIGEESEEFQEAICRLVLAVGEGMK